MSAVTVDDRAVQAAFARMIAAGRNPRTFLGPIGALLVESTRLRFRDSRAPDGSSWAPLSPVTLARRRGGGGKPLLDTGRMRNSITYLIDGNSVIVGTNVIQGRMQQMGARKGAFGRTVRGAPIPWGPVPGRAYLGVSAADRRGIVGILALKLGGEQ